MTIKKKISILNNYLKSNLTKSKILLYKNKVNFIKSDNIKDNGYLYIAFKKNFLDEAILSALSLKRNTQKKIAIFMNYSRKNSQITRFWTPFWKKIPKDGSYFSLK